MPVPHRLQNISARAQVQTGDNVLIAGLIITGSAPKQLLLRALGPSLSVNGEPVTGRLLDPTLELYAADSDIPIAQNNDWKSTQRPEIEATGLAPTSEFESAIVATLDPGQYTAIVRGWRNSTGVSLVEAFELTSARTAKFANISARGFIGTGDNALIGGLIAGGGDVGASVRVVVRGIGPSLSQHNVSNALADPTIELFDANGVSLGFNDDWMNGGQAGEVIETGLQPENEKESAIVAVLTGGNYTAVLRGKNDGTGVGLIEFYEAQQTLPASEPVR